MLRSQRRIGTYEGVSGKYVGQVCAPALAGSDLAASLVDRAPPLKPMRRASFVQRLAANPFEQALHQVDRVVAALAAIFTSRIRLHPDDLIAIYGFRSVGLAHVWPLPVCANFLLGRSGFYVPPWQRP